MNATGTLAATSTQSLRIGRYALALTIAWTVLLFSSFGWFYYQENNNMFEESRAQARTALESGFLYRQWVARRGGIYVISDAHTPPNPVLAHVPERDVTTPSGKKLTLVNAAYLARLVHEFASKEQFKITGEKQPLHGHLTSLNPIRPENAPDAWEEKSLKKFELGVKETSSIEKINGIPYMRVMRASNVVEGCLKCHPDYRVGAVRGGVSFSLPMTQHLATTRKQVVNGAITHCFIWVFGIGMIRFGKRRVTTNLQDLEKSEEQFRTLTNLAPTGICLMDADGACRYVNQRWCSLTGLDSAAAMGDGWISAIHPGDRSRALSSWRAETDSKGHREAEFRFMTPSGQVVWVYGVITPTLDHSNTVNGYIGITMDITDRKQAEADIRKLSQAVAQSPIAIAITDTAGNAEFVNPEFNRLTGFAAGDLIGRNLRLLNSGANDREVYRGLWNSINTGATWQGELKNRKKSGEIFWCTETIAPIRNEAGETTNFVAVIEDINDRKFAEETIQKLAFYDPLTELPNRRLLQERLMQTVSHAKRDGTRVALLYLDIDNFKMVNDTLGHPVGDRLLMGAAGRFSNCVRETDTFARLGGDEFALVMSNVTHNEDVAIVAEKLLASIEEPLVIEGRELYLTVSIGISLFPADTDTIDDLIRYADVAMYEAKGKGRNTFQFFCDDLNKRFEERHFISNSLHQALKQDEFSLCYQPKQNIATGAVYGMEALIRWNHPEYGMIPPEKFIPIAEENLEIVRIGYWVLQTACREAKRLLDQGHDLKLSVNLSSVQFHQPDLCESLALLLNEIGLPPASLELEITESALAKVPEDAIKVLTAIRKLGVSVSIDDFGTGYSSLSQLKNLPVNTLKIDRSFIRDICTERSAYAISTSIITLAHSLDLDVIAEGVESDEQLQILKALGCDSIQGFLLGEALSPAEFSGFLKR